MSISVYQKVQKCTIEKFADNYPFCEFCISFALLSMLASSDLISSSSSGETDVVDVAVTVWVFINFYFGFSFLIIYKNKLFILQLNLVQVSRWQIGNQGWGELQNWIWNAWLLPPLFEILNWYGTFKREINLDDLFLKWKNLTNLSASL